MNIPMERLFVLVAIFWLLLFGCVNRNQTSANIVYDVSFPNAVHNEAQVTLTVSNLNPTPVHFSMSRSSPGRYALHEFAKNVYNVQAVDGHGDTLAINHTDLHNWIINKNDGTIKFSYTLYADHAGGTYSGVNREHAHLNMPATFVWARDFTDQPITVRFHPPVNSRWKVATQLKSTDNPDTFTAPDFSYFMDSPTELSNFSMNSWTVRRDTTHYTYRLALHHNGTPAQMEDYTDMAKKVVNEEIAVYGEPASYDYGTYTFIADYLPYVYGDGMEHRNSTSITSSQSLKDGAKQNLSTLAHEFFHSWNVERIRPEGLKPFDFTKANVSGALWFAEGFTSYYANLIMRRTGFQSNGAFARGWDEILNYVINSPGSRYYSPVEMSRQAPFVDAATSIDQQNKSNTFISYYWWGAMLGMSLDLKLRTTFDDVTLDDYMRMMWHEYGEPEKAYSLDDLQAALAEVTDSTEFAKIFFKQYIYGKQLVDLKPLLAKAGFSLEKAHPGRAVISYGNAKINFEKGNPVITSNTINDSPLYKAGLDRGDIILTIEGQSIANARKLQRMLAKHTPGDSLSIRFKSLNKEYTSTLVLAEDQTLQMIPYEQDGKKMTSAIKSFREDWLGRKAAK